MKLLIQTLAVFLAFSSNLIAEDIIPNPTQTETQAMEVLMKIESFGFGGGRGQRERLSDTAFQTLISDPNAKEKFTTLFVKGNTCSKLYALCALHSIDPSAFQKLSKSIKMDEEINTQNGCIVSNMKSSEILADISKGNFDNYAKAQEKD
jgi:hypothetical protein